MLRTLALPVVCLALLAPAVDAGAQEVIQQNIRISAPEGGPISILPPGRQPKTGTGRVLGRIVASDTGTPLRRAQVRISGPDIGTKTALTDAQGRYEFKELPAGRFNVSVTKSGFVNMQFGQNRPYEPGRPIELSDAQVMEKADLALPRGSVLAGRIVDEFGEAVAEAEVSAMRMQYTNGKRRLTPSGRTGITNDLGQFRIYGLPPGEYYVSASLRSSNAVTMLDMGPGSMIAGQAAQNQTTGYASTFYPGTPSPAEAQRVSLAVGQELSSVDIQLQPVRLAKVSGTAVSSDGKPMSGATVMLMPASRDAIQFMPGGTSRTGPDGQFTLSSVTPGDYMLQVQSGGATFVTSAGGSAMTFAFATVDRSSPGGGQPQAQEREFATTAVSVAGEDITGMVVIGTRGAKAAGTLVFEGGMKPEGITGVRITTPSIDADTPMPGIGAGAVKDTGAFEIEGLIGTRLFRAGNPPKGWIMKRVTVNGQDVTDKGIEFKPGEDVSGIEIEMTNRSTSLSGSVTDDKGQPNKEYTVVIFSDDESKWTLTANRWLSSARPDQEGRFRFNALPPGSYYAIAMDYVPAGEWQDPEWLSRASKKATKITLDEGASKTLDLKLAGS